MATSGSISRSAGFGNVTLSWSRTSISEANNTSTLSYSLVINRNLAIYSSASKSYSIIFNGSTVASGSTTIGGSGAKTIKSGSVTIPHNSDGSKTFNFSFSQQIDITFSGSWIGTLSDSGSGVLDPIARTSKHTINVSNQFLGSTITISTNRASSAFTHTVTYSFNGTSGTIGTANGVTTSVSWILPASLADRIPNSTSGSGTIKCITYSGSTKIGEHSVNFTATVPNTATYNPSIGGISVSENNSTVTLGAYIQNMSRLNINMTGATARYSATIQSYRITFNGGTWNSSSAVTGAIKNSGTLPITATIVDSRGRTATASTNVTVLAYSPPVISVLNASRANSNGTLNQVGTSALITRTASSSSLIVGGTQRNNLRYAIMTREKGVTAWTSKITLTTHSSLSLTGTNTLSTYDITKSYDVLVEVRDLYNTTTAMATISSGQVTMSWGRTGVGIGKVWEQGALDVQGDAYISGVSHFGSELRYTGTFSTANRVLDMGQGYVIFSDNVGTGASNNRLWFDAPNNSEIVFGSRNGSFYSEIIRMRTRNLEIYGEIINQNPINASLVNGWSNYSPNGGTYEQCKYWKDKNGVVHITGLINGGTTTGGTLLFTLPVGYRPSATEMFYCLGGSLLEPCRIDIRANGEVAGLRGLKSEWVSLAGISFKAGA